MSKTNNDSPCPICLTSRSDIFFESRLNHSVRSDWATLPVSTVVLKCTDCGHLFKPSDFVRAGSDYQAYSAWGNSPERDKTDFSLGTPVTRSAAIVKFLRDRWLAPETHRILDYGCNRGAFLVLLGAGVHAGFDVSEQYRSIIENRGYEYFTPGSPPPRRKYDVVTLIHVLEHLSSVADDMKHGTEALKEQGSILVQVPNVATQPTDLYVADHFSHFLKSTLVRAMLGIRFDSVEPVTSILPGELTGLFQSVPVRNTATPQDDCVYNLIKSSLDRGEDILLRLKAQKTPCLIFGAGFLGSLVAAELEGQVQGFVDDNAMMYTDTWGGLPIQALLDIRSKATIVVAVPPNSAVRVAERCKAQGHSVEVPFPL